MRKAISAAQIRGARAMLDWSLADLASAARLSVSVIKRVQYGSAGAETSIGAIQDALETGGVRFMADDGDGGGIQLRSWHR